MRVNTRAELAITERVLEKTGALRINTIAVFGETMLVWVGTGAELVVTNMVSAINEANLVKIGVVLAVAEAEISQHETGMNHHACQTF